MESENLASFVSCFVAKERRERLLHESKDLKKRRVFFDRFAHETQQLLDRKLIVLQGNRLKEEKVLKTICGDGKAPDKFILIVDYQIYESGDGKALMKTAFDCFGQSILLCDRFAFIKEETEYGAPEKILLKNLKFSVK